MELLLVTLANSLVPNRIEMSVPLTQNLPTMVSLVLTNAKNLIWIFLITKLCPTLTTGRDGLRPLPSLESKTNTLICLTTRDSVHQVYMPQSPTTERTRLRGLVACFQSTSISRTILPTVVTTRKLAFLLQPTCYLNVMVKPMRLLKTLLYREKGTNL